MLDYSLLGTHRSWRMGGPAQQRCLPQGHTLRDCAVHHMHLASTLEALPKHIVPQAFLSSFLGCRLLADSQELAQREAAEQKATRPGYGPAGQHSSSIPSQTGPLSPGQLATPMRIGQDLHGFLTGSAQHIPAGESPSCSCCSVLLC